MPDYSEWATISNMLESTRWLLRLGLFAWVAVSSACRFSPLSLDTLDSQNNDTTSHGNTNSNTNDNNGTCTAASDCNVAPVAQINTGAAILVTPPGQPLTLDASQSTDADGDPLTFTWSAQGCTLSSSTGVSSVVSLVPDSRCDVALEVSDGLDSHTVSVRVVEGTIDTYVRPTNCVGALDPLDTAPQGTADAPFCSLSDAIAAAQISGNPIVRVHTGSVDGDVSITFPVTISGGHSSTEGWTVTGTTGLLVDRPAGLTIEAAGAVKLENLNIDRVAACDSCTFLSIGGGEVSLDSVAIGTQTGYVGEDVAGVRATSQHPMTLSATDTRVELKGGTGRGYGWIVAGVDNDASTFSFIDSTVELAATSGTAIGIHSRRGSEVALTRVQVDVSGASNALAHLDGASSATFSTCSGAEPCDGSKSLKYLNVDLNAQAAIFAGAAAFHGTGSVEWQVTVATEVRSVGFTTTAVWTVGVDSVSIRGGSMLAVVAETPGGEARGFADGWRAPGPATGAESLTINQTTLKGGATGSATAKEVVAVSLDRTYGATLTENRIETYLSPGALSATSVGMQLTETTNVAVKQNDFFTTGGGQVSSLAHALRDGVPDGVLALRERAGSSGLILESNDFRFEPTLKDTSAIASGVLLFDSSNALVARNTFGNRVHLPVPFPQLHLLATTSVEVLNNSFFTDGSDQSGEISIGIQDGFSSTYDELTVAPIPRRNRVQALTETETNWGSNELTIRDNNFKTASGTGVGGAGVALLKGQGDQILVGNLFEMSGENRAAIAVQKFAGVIANTTFASPESVANPSAARAMLLLAEPTSSVTLLQSVFHDRWSGGSMPFIEVADSLSTANTVVNDHFARFESNVMDGDTFFVVPDVGLVVDDDSETASPSTWNGTVIFTSGGVVCPQLYPSDGSVLVDNGTGEFADADDIYGTPRTNTTTDIGALERPSAAGLGCPDIW